MVHFFLQIILSSCLKRVAKPTSRECKLMLPFRLSSAIVKRFQVKKFSLSSFWLNTHILSMWAFLVIITSTNKYAI